MAIPRPPLCSAGFPGDDASAALAIAPDLSSLVFVTKDVNGLAWRRSTLGRVPIDLKARPGLPLIYATSPDEDVLSLRLHQDRGAAGPEARETGRR